MLIIGHLGLSASSERVLDLSGPWQFTIGDNMDWREGQFNDSDWESIHVPSPWEEQGFYGYDGYAWYRKSFQGEQLRQASNLYLHLGHIDDVDEVYINGKLVGFTGNYPPNFKTAYHRKRIYHIPKSYINPYGKNTIAIRVYDSVLGGGIMSGDIGIYQKENYAPQQLILEGVWEMKMDRWKYRKSKPYSDWQKVMVPMRWDQMGIRQDYNDVAWYRKYFTLPEDFPTENLSIILGKIDDFDEVFINGIRIGSTNDGKRFGSSDSWSQDRVYSIPEDCLKKNEPNVILVRVIDIGIDGGIYEGPVMITNVGYASQAIYYYRRR